MSEFLGKSTLFDEIDTKSTRGSPCIYWVVSKMSILIPISESKKNK